MVTASARHVWTSDDPLDQSIALGADAKAIRVQASQRVLQVNFFHCQELAAGHAIGVWGPGA